MAVSTSAGSSLGSFRGPSADCDRMVVSMLLSIGRCAVQLSQVILGVGAQAFRLSASGCAARPEAALGEMQRPQALLGAWLGRGLALGCRRWVLFFASVLQAASFLRIKLDGIC